MRKPRVPFWEWCVVAACAVFFVVPMLTMARFALQRVPVVLLGRDTIFSRWTLKGVVSTLTDEKFRPAMLLSLRLGILTVILVLLLMVPTVLWVHISTPRWRAAVEIMSMLPYVVPPIALVVGVSGAFRDSFPWLVASNNGLVPLYAVLCLPFAFRSLDAGASHWTCARLSMPDATSVRARVVSSGRCCCRTWPCRSPRPGSSALRW
ncbi:MAG: hypothetical protein RL430_1843 [Actinomycetota bacterium]